MVVGLCDGVVEVLGFLESVRSTGCPVSGLLPVSQRVLDVLRIEEVVPALETFEVDAAAVAVRSFDK